MEEQPKRRGPKSVPSVVVDNIRYEVITSAKARGFGQDGGVIAAVDVATGSELWSLVVYKTAYEPGEEQDVQERYITKLTLTKDKNVLRVDNESHKSYLVNLSSHEVSEVSGNR